MYVCIYIYIYIYIYILYIYIYYILLVIIYLLQFKFFYINMRRKPYALSVLLVRVLITNMASVVPTPGVEPNYPSEMLTMSLSLWSKIRSQSVMAWVSSLIPCS